MEMASSLVHLSLAALLALALGSPASACIYLYGEAKDSLVSGWYVSLSASMRRAGRNHGGGGGSSCHLPVVAAIALRAEGPHPREATDDPIGVPSRIPCAPTQQRRWSPSACWSSLSSCYLPQSAITYPSLPLYLTISLPLLRLPSRRLQRRTMISRPGAMTGEPECL